MAGSRCGSVYHGLYGHILNALRGLYRSHILGSVGEVLLRLRIVLPVILRVALLIILSLRLNVSLSLRLGVILSIGLSKALRAVVCGSVLRIDRSIGVFGNRFYGGFNLRAAMGAEAYTLGNIGTAVCTIHNNSPF